MTEGQNRRRQEAHGQRTQDDLEQRSRSKILPRRRKCPRLEKNDVNQKQNGLKNGQKADEASSYSHVYLDSRCTQKVICRFTVQRAVCNEEWTCTGEIRGPLSSCPTGSRDNFGRRPISATIAGLHWTRRTHLPCGFSTKMAISR